MSHKITPLTINKEIAISSFYTIDYYNLNKDFYQLPDSHPYWEMVYVDKGDVISNYNGIGHTLSEGEVIFHPPGSMHSHISNKVVENSILVVSFESDSKLLDKLKQKTFFLTNQTKKILSLFLEECTLCLGNINNPSGGLPQPLSLAKKAIGESQMLECYFLEFIYSIIRTNSYSLLEKSEASYMLASNSFVELIKSYLRDNINRNLTLDDLCKKFNVSKSHLCKKWKEHNDIGVIDYFISLKIKEAKQLLQQKEYSITQIADMLSYSTIHHFSHSFKKQTGLSPSEYKNTVLPL